MLAPETIAVMETAHQALDQAVPPEERLTIAGKGRKRILTLRLLRDRKPQLVIAKTTDKAGNAVRFEELTEFPNNRFRPHHSAEAAKWTTVKGLFAAARLRLKNAAAFNAEWSNAVQTGAIRRKAARQARRFAAERAEDALGPAQEKQATARLIEFIGPELWSISKKIWGDGTTLRHLNFLAAAGTGNVRRALSQSPRIVTLALRNPQEGQAGPIPAAGILEKGRRQLREIMSEGAHPQETEEAWIKALEWIDSKALQKTGVREYLPELVRAIMEADRKLPRFVVRELYEMRLDWNPFIKKENEQEKTLRRRAAAAAARCLHADPGTGKELEKSLSLYHRRIKPALEAAEEEPEYLLKKLAEEERQEAEKRKPGKPPPCKPQYAVKKPDAGKIAEALARLERTSLVKATKDSAALTAGPSGPALYEIRREADGTLVQESRETASPLMDSQGRFQWRNSRPMPHFNAPAIALAIELHPEIEIESGAPEAVAAVCEAAGILKEAGIYGRLARRASREMAKAASRLCRPEAAERAVRIAGRAASPQPWIDIEQHNAALTAGAALEDLAGTNPGAAAYLIGCHPEKIRELRHPGQLVTVAKKNLPRRNPERIWKRIAGAEPEAIDILAQENPERKPRYGLQAHLLAPAAAEAANMAGTGRLNRDQARMLRQTVGSRQQPRNQGYEVFLSLCMKEPLKALETPAEAMRQAEDYCRNAAPTARTLGGLLKASRRWHLGISRRRIKDLVGNRKKLVWESVIGETQVRKNITAVPLNGTMELAEESKRMGHCVYTYDAKCYSGNARIFHLSTGATCELRMEEGRWSAGETRRENNTAPTEKDEEAARRLAEIYHEAWLKQRKSRAGPGKSGIRTNG